MISPKESQSFGLLVSVVVGLAVLAIVWGLFAYTFDFWNLDKILGRSIGAALGIIAAVSLFTSRQREVPLNWVGVSLAIGKPTGSLYENGNHWVFPFCDIRIVPGPREKFILKMPGEMFNAQDGNLVYFGISPEEPEKRNRIQYSVIDPIAYLAVDAPEDSLREAYLEKARLFFGQAKKAYGVKNEQTLFSDYIVLASKTGAATEKFAERLKKTMYTVRGGETEEERLFSDESIRIIIDNAGEFVDSAAIWGIGNILAFTPSVRENPEMEAADAARQAANAEMSAAQTRTQQIEASSDKLVKHGVSPDLAASLAAKLVGQDVNVENKTITYSGLAEVVKVLGAKWIDTLNKPQPRNRPPKQWNNKKGAT